MSKIPCEYSGGVQEVTLTLAPNTYPHNDVHAYIKDGFCYVQGYLAATTLISLPSGLSDLVTGFPRYAEQPLFSLFDYSNSKVWSGRLTNNKLQIYLPSAQSIGSLCVNFVYKIA